MVWCMNGETKSSRTHVVVVASSLLLAVEEVDERSVEVLRGLFVGQVADALEGCQASVAEISLQRLGGAEADGAIARPPKQQSGIVTNLWQHLLKFGQVRCPGADDPQSVLEGPVLAHGHAVALERIRRDLCPISEQAAQPKVIEEVPAANRMTKEKGAEGTACKRSEPLSMGRPGIDGCDQHQTFQARVMAFGTDGGREHSDGTAVRSSEQVEFGDAERNHELQEPFGGGAHAAVHPRRTGRKAVPETVHRINGGVLRQHRSGKSPGKGIREQSMYQNQRGAPPR